MRKDKISQREYGRIHYWLRMNYGKPTKCESDKCNGKSKYFTWALIRGKKYERKRENFMQLCKSCHTKYDLTEEGKKKISKFMKGRKRPEQAEFMRKTRKGAKYPSLYKEVYVYDKKYNLVKKFESLKSASEWIGVGSHQVTMVASPKYWWSKTIKGYIISYKKLKNEQK